MAAFIPFPLTPARLLATWSDEKLLATLCQDDHLALAELFRRYYGIAHRLAARRDQTRLDDRIDDAFFYVWKHAYGSQRTILTARCWIVGMLDRALIQNN